MKRTIIILALLAAYLMVPGLPAVPGHLSAAAAFAQADDAEAMDPEASGGEEAEEEGDDAAEPENDELTPGGEAIREVLGDYAIAMANFPARRDVAAITRHFAEGYARLNDGIEENADDTVGAFDEIEEQITLGNMVVITSRIDDFYGESKGDLGWGTYRLYFKAVVSGELFTEDEKSCLAVFEKEEGTWLIRTEQCTSVFTDDLAY